MQCADFAWSSPAIFGFAKSGVHKHILHLCWIWTCSQLCISSGCPVLVVPCFLFVCQFLSVLVQNMLRFCLVWAKMIRPRHTAEC
jgi:hypothetical protein